MGGRRYSREIALKVLFHLEFNKDTLEEAVEKLTALYGWNSTALEYAMKLLNKVVENKEEIDSFISKASKNWRLQRIANVERCILRLATAELLYLHLEVPPKVCIDEAIDMAKMFGNDESGSFVNGIMDYIYKNVYAGSEEDRGDGIGKGGDNEIQPITN